MPNSTFFNLPEGKQQIIINAARKEFSRVPLPDALIANIVKEAEISRGSFYQYFEDKEDAFFYILNSYAKEKQQKFLMTLKNAHGDLFYTMEVMFHEILKELQMSENRRFFGNALMNMNHKVESSFSKMIYQNGLDKNLNVVSQLIDMDKLNVSNDKELYYAIQIIKTITFQNLSEKFAKDLSIEEAINNYRTQMNLIKKGLEKD
ncbi:TetR family transcriptional regulator [Shouchella clausii]|nr:TetR family transcriptional regulator [Shouchella clausii]